jgi:basic membrane protein A and related proteins
VIRAARVRLGVLPVVLAVVVTLAAACTSAETAAPTTSASPTTTEAPEPTVLKVAWINQGSVADDPWTVAHERGRQAVEQALGAEVETTFREHINPGAPAAAELDALVRDGNQLIFATSFPLAEDLADAAKRHPEVRFAQARGVQTSANLGTYSGADEEPLYLAGMAAGAATTSGSIGFVGTVPEPETIRHINAFTLGVRAVRSGAEVRVRWIGSWFDLEEERSLAEGLVDDGADVVATGTISPVVGQVAADRGISWVGHDSDWSEEYPDGWLTAAVPDWSSYYVDQVEAVSDGTWQPLAYYGDMADGFTDLAALGTDVPASIRDQLAQVRAEFRGGEREVFAGPIEDQSGTVRVAVGESLSPQERSRLSWFVRGVVGDPTASS